MRSAGPVLVVHNYYQQPGGEDQVFAAETRLLESRGHEVIRFTLHNDAITGLSRARLVSGAIWQRSAYRDLRGLIRKHRPLVMHCHNTFPLVSPAAYYAARAEGVPVVQTLHNYRLACANGLLFREGQVCESCVGKAVPWPGVVHRCYRDSRTATATVAAMLTVHRAMRTWKRMVDAYIALSDFSRRKFEEIGIAKDKLHVKPNFLFETPEVGDGAGGYALFVGRLSREKGVACLLRAVERLGGRIPVVLVGDGPLAGSVSQAAKENPNVKWVGHQSLEEIYQWMGRARFLVFPSELYETFGRVIAESLACGTPVVASRLGAMAELVEHERTGLLFSAGDSEDLARKMEWALSHESALAEMRRTARAEFEAKYTADRNYDLLMEIYAHAGSSASH